ncbi:kinase-like protein [Fomitiporia mediterranea MF3/22]|uniref:kinase-like protein n=1 Tax=Fomitiporia mediterranea (strain MF3/22) TaxID=694068 RepID=UPI0004407614|nr:kinase-like protein [Fomitiporia mediterranea MF3/22]EJD00127.1 kinase-like protein [Fomitiporia mediterranea MF3/22]
MSILKREKVVRPILDLLHNAINNTGVTTELPDIRSLCLVRMMELAIRIGNLPPSMRIDSDVQYLPNSVSYVAKGGFGYIFKTRRRSDDALIAIKVPKEEIQEKQKSIFREVILWSCLRHANILPFIGTCKFRGRFPCIASPWMERGTVIEYCSDRSGYLSVKLKLLGQVASALDYLHNHDPQVVHEDVRGANILVNDLGNAVLSDFGISRINSEAFADLSSRLQHGNIRWTAPELLFETKDGHQPKPRSQADWNMFDSGSNVTKASTHSDMWSFGMTIVEVLTGRVPFADAIGRFDAAVVMHIHDRNLPRRPAPDGVDVPDPLWRAIEQCWDERPEARPSASQMVSHLKDAEIMLEVNVQLRPEPSVLRDIDTREGRPLYSSTSAVRLNQ